MWLYAISDNGGIPYDHIFFEDKLKLRQLA